MNTTSDIRTITTRGAQFNVVSGRYDSFWESFENGWEATSLQAFDTHFKDDGTFLDIGSWIGPMALYAASRGQRVICIEADPVALTELQQNIAANPALASKITIIDRAIYPTSGKVQFGTKGKQGNSKSSFIASASDEVWTVGTITPLEIAELIGETSSLLVKMDIEGGEYIVFPPLFAELEALNPAYVISLHPAHLPDGYLTTRKLSRGIFALCKARRAVRLRNAPRFAGKLREQFVRLAWCPAVPRGTWLFSRH